MTSPAEQHPLAATGVQHYVRKVCYAVLQDWHLTEECSQEVFLKALERWEEFDQSRPLIPWIKAMAWWMAYNLRRRTERHEAIVLHRAHRFVREVESPETRVISDDSCDLIRHTVDQVAGMSSSPHSQHVLKRIWLEGATYMEVASEILTSHQAVQSQIQYARKRIGERLRVA